MCLFKCKRNVYLLILCILELYFSHYSAQKSNCWCIRFFFGFISMDQWHDVMHQVSTYVESNGQSNKIDVNNIWQNKLWKYRKKNVYGKLLHVAAQNIFLIFHWRSCFFEFFYPEKTQFNCRANESAYLIHFDWSYHQY